MKKLLSLALALALALSLGAFAGPAALAEDDDFGVFPAVAGEDGTTYVNLFDVILAEDCQGLWHDYIGAVVAKLKAIMNEGQMR